MRRFSILIIVAILIGLPILVDAASIMNSDNEVYQIKGARLVRIGFMLILIPREQNILTVVTGVSLSW